MINKHLRNEDGLTLIELLAVVILTSLIGFFSFNLIVSSMNHYKTISIENELRDEADLIMTKLFREIYTMKESEILRVEQKNLLDDGKYRDSYIVYRKILSDGSSINTKTGFIDGKIFIHDEEFQIQNNRVRIDSPTLYSSISSLSNGVYSINLVLYLESKQQQLTFYNEIKSVNNMN